MCKVLSDFGKSYSAGGHTKEIKYDNSKKSIKKEEVNVMVQNILDQILQENMYIKMSAKFDSGFIVKRWNPYMGEYNQEMYKIYIVILKKKSNYGQKYPKY